MLNHRLVLNHRLLLLSHMLLLHSLMLNVLLRLMLNGLLYLTLKEFLTSMILWPSIPSISSSREYSYRKTIQNCSRKDRSDFQIHIGKLIKSVPV
jgi:hypothetical protein